MQYMLDAVKFKGVSSIGTALKTCHHVVVGSEHINYFAFSFVAPLEAQENIYFAHYNNTIVEKVSLYSFAKVRTFFNI